MVGFGRITAAVLGLLTLTGCGVMDGFGFGRDRTPDGGYAMRWDHVPGSEEWEARGYAALRSHAAVLPTLEPDDIGAWCPAYPRNDVAEREAFWLGLLSSLSRHESTYNPQAVGGGGRWFGLVQISPATARFYGCEAGSGQALLNGGANVSCALQIWSTTVVRDNVVATGRRGVAADWGPMHPSQAEKREDIRAWVSQQSYCTR